MKTSGQKYESESDIKGGKPQPVGGTYHVGIVYADDSHVSKNGTSLNADVYELEVYAGTVPGQEGTFQKMYINLPDEKLSAKEFAKAEKQYMDKCDRLCVATGAYVAGATEIPAAAIQNRQMIVKIEEWEYEGKKGKRIADFGLAMWSVDSPEVADVPKNMEAIRLWREASGQATNGHASQPAMADAGVGVGAGSAADDI